MFFDPKNLKDGTIHKSSYVSSFGLLAKKKIYKMQ